MVVTLFYDAEGEIKAVREEIQMTESVERSLCCNDAEDSSSDLILACEPTTVRGEEGYEYDGESCLRTFDLE